MGAELLQHARGRPKGCPLGRRALVGRTGRAAAGGAEDKDEDAAGRVVGGEESVAAAPRSKNFPCRPFTTAPYGIHACIIHALPLPRTAG